MVILSPGWLVLMWYATAAPHSFNSTPITIRWPLLKFLFSVSSSWSASITWSAKPKSFLNPRTMIMSTSPSRAIALMAIFCTSIQVCRPVTVQFSMFDQAANAASIDILSWRSSVPSSRLDLACILMPWVPTTLADVMAKNFLA